MAVSNLILAALAANLFQDTVNANTPIVVKGSAGTLYLIHIDNTLNGVPSFVKLYDTAAVVTVGTTAPDWIIKVPAGVKLPVPFVGGVAFAAGLQAATVTTGGTSGTTSPASAVALSISYS